MRERKYKIDRETALLVNKETGIPIPLDEPVFVFRAQDQKSLAALVAYSLTLNSLHHRAEMQKSIEDFRRFQADHPERVKEPD